MRAVRFLSPLLTLALLLLGCRAEEIASENGGGAGGGGGSETPAVVWDRVSEGLSSRPVPLVEALDIGVFASTETVLARLIEGQSSWVPTALTPGVPTEYLRHDAGRGLTYALASGVLYRSSNGTAWSALTTPAAPVGIALGEGGDLVALSSSARLVSSDGGETWSQSLLVGFAEDTDEVARLESYPASGGVRYAALPESGGLYLSEDALAWARASGAGSAVFAAFAQGPGGELYAVPLSGGIVRSLDGGATWSEVGQGTLGQQSGGRTDLAANSEGDLFVSLLGGSIFRSLDRGETWESYRGQPGEGATDLDARILSISLGADERLFAASDAGRVFVTATPTTER
jgi:photosystem II stability/assembly factor-like uncharacterized protein